MGEHEGTSIVIYDAECAFCRAAARWLERHDRRRRLRFQPIADVVDVRGLRLDRAVLEVEMHVIDAGGQIERGFRGWRRIARAIPLLRPVSAVLWLPGVAPIGDRVYRWVAAHRSWLSRTLGFDTRGTCCSR